MSVFVKILEPRKGATSCLLKKTQSELAHFAPNLRLLRKAGVAGVYWLRFAHFALQLCIMRML
jgi:hypothetical protein